MIKLVEVVSVAGNYNPEKGTSRVSYSLRDVYINPSFVVSMTDNEKFNELHKRSPILEDLRPEARFTKLLVARGGHGVASYDILDSPEQHLSKIRGEQG